MVIGEMILVGSETGTSVEIGDFWYFASMQICGPEEERAIDENEEYMS